MMRTTFTKFVLIALICFAAAVFGVSSVQAADPFDFVYSGRVADETGKPFTGNVNFQIDFFTLAKVGRRY